MTRALAVVTLVVAAALGCGRGKQAPQTVAPAEDLAAARQGFVTNLRVRGPAPQPFENETPPAGVEVVEYPSGSLKLKGWLSSPPVDSRTCPAVVFLHGGWAFGGQDWLDAQPFADAGFVLFTPMLRGENGNPGDYESFLGEVDDAVAAGKYVASLPHVDSKNVFVAGHSVGAVLTCLTAMLPSPYKGAASFDGYLDMPTWAKFSPPEQVPYDPHSAAEVRVRNPLEFALSIRCPLRLYVGGELASVNAPLAARARAAGRDCDFVVVGGDHHSMVPRAMPKAIEFFKSLQAR